MKQFKVLKFDPVMLGRKCVGGKKYPKKTGKTKLVTGDSHGEKNSFLSVTGLVAFFSPP